MRRWAVVAAVALALAGCGGSKRAGPQPGPTAAPRPPTEAERIAAVLDRRAQRIGSEQAKLGVRRARYALEEVDVSGRTARVRARLAYRVQGVEGEFGATRRLALRKRAGRWRVDRVLGERDAEPWEADDYVRERTEHFVVWVPSGVPTPAGTLEAGYERLGDVLEGEALQDRYLVVVARDSDAARQITRRIAGLESLTALTDTQVSIGGPAERVREVRSQRLIVNAAAFAQIDAASQEQVATHELTHAVLAPQTSTRTPSWLVEGVALYASGDDRRPEYFSLPLRLTLAGLSAPDAIGRLQGEAQRAAYATASAVAFYITDVYGEEALLELLAAYSRRSVRGERGDPQLSDRALRRVLGIGLAELQRRLG